MIECGDCGTDNADDAAFCQNPSCGAFLEWSGTKKEDAVTAVGAPAGRAGEEATAIIPVNGGQTVQQRPGPGATKPGREHVPAPAHAVKRRPPLEVGDLVCENCGTGNLPHIHFCRQCAASLAYAPEVRPTWWQKLLGRRPPPAAGTRPGWKRARAKDGSGQLPRGAVVALGLLAAAAALFVGGLIAWRAGANDAAVRGYDSARRTLFPRYEPVRPVFDRSTSARPRHRAHAAFDQDVNTFWLTRRRRKGNGARLIARFQPATDLARIGIFGGDPIARNLVPKKLQLAFFRRPEPPARRWLLAGVRTISLENKPGFQRAKLDIDNVQRVVITVRGTYGSDVPRTSAALTEVEFHRRK